MAAPEKSRCSIRMSPISRWTCGSDGSSSAARRRTARAPGKSPFSRRAMPFLKSACASGLAALVGAGARPNARTMTPHSTERVYCMFMPLAAMTVLYLLQASASQLNPARSYLEQGLELASRGRLEAALGRMEMATRLRPDLAEAWFSLGALQHARGNADLAIGSLEKALALRPDYGEALNALGLIYEQQGEPAKAVALLNRGLKTANDASEVRHNLAIAL